ncbi:MAG: bifunctional tetrahydrofolate synthase/dihydrofolate synthase [Gammaproteobacteria bacterium]|nr:bifunctional tetrahydrofolate synthase/dihydrofolate synthase [Gammaproteobacteria bacterium]
MLSSLADWLHYIEQIHPKTIELTLARIQNVASRLGLLLTQKKRVIITVGGTNGKGSCVASIESLLLETGASVGAYFSPHLFRFNERIRLNGREVTDEQLCAAFTEIEKARAEISLTYFEFATLAACFLFQQEKIAYWVLEVGLGGRYDAVNIFSADIAVIASVSLDHLDYLGETRELIAYEKAGIFRKNGRVVYGESDVPASIWERALALETHFSCQGQEFGFIQQEESWRFWGEKQFDQLPKPIVSLQNAATALQVVSLLPTIKIRQEEVVRGLNNINLQGRFQLIQTEAALFVFDVAHNPASAQLLAENLTSIKKYRKIHALVGMLKDKDCLNTLRPLSAIIDMWWVAGLSGERGLSCVELMRVLSSLTSSPLQGFVSPEEAYQTLLYHVHPEDCVVVFGSFLTVTPVLERITCYSYV